MRKDIECVFGILQSKFAILRVENRRLYLNDIVRITNSCVLIHNFLIRSRQFTMMGNDLIPKMEKLNMLMNIEQRMGDLSNAEYRRNVEVLQATFSNNEYNEAERLLLLELNLTYMDEHVRLTNALLQLIQEYYSWCSDGSSSSSEDISSSESNSEIYL